MQGVKVLGITSSTTLQHLPIDKSLEKKLPESITGRLAFAVQKLGEIVQTAQVAAKLTPGEAKIPAVGESEFAKKLAALYAPWFVLCAIASALACVSMVHLVCQVQRFLWSAW